MATKKKSVRKKKSTSQNKKFMKSVPKKINLLLKNLAIFAVLLIISMILYSASSSILLQNIFLMASILFGFIALAFLIALLIFFVLKLTKK